MPRVLVALAILTVVVIAAQAQVFNLIASHGGSHADKRGVWLLSADYGRQSYSKVARLDTSALSASATYTSAFDGYSNVYTGTTNAKNFWIWELFSQNGQYLTPAFYTLAAAYNQQDDNLYIVYSTDAISSVRPVSLGFVDITSTSPSMTSLTPPLKAITFAPYTYYYPLLVTDGMNNMYFPVPYNNTGSQVWVWDVSSRPIGTSNFTVDFEIAWMQWDSVHEYFIVISPRSSYLSLILAMDRTGNVLSLLTTVPAALYYYSQLCAYDVTEEILLVQHPYSAYVCDLSSLHGRGYATVAEVTSVSSVCTISTINWNSMGLVFAFAPWDGSRGPRSNRTRAESGIPLVNVH